MLKKLWELPEEKRTKILITIIVVFIIFMTVICILSYRPYNPQKANTETCKICNHNYSNETDMKSIRKTNMCCRCYKNYNYAQNVKKI